MFLIATPARAGGRILNFSIGPENPTTGDPIRLRVEIELGSCCAEPVVSIGFGPQHELNGADGWGIDLEVTPGPLPQITVIPIDERLGPLPPASGEGVLRLRLNGETVDARLFDLTVQVGPVAGWKQPAGHGGFSIPAAIAGIASLPGQLAFGAPGGRSILLVDEESGGILDGFTAPGTGDVRGVATDGTVLFLSIADFPVPRIYRVDRLGRVLDAFPSPVVSQGNAPLEALAWRDGILYGVYPSPSILFALSPDDGRTLWSRALSTSMHGLAPVPTGLIGAERGGFFYFVEASPEGHDLLTADPADHGLVQPDLTGLAYDGFGLIAWDGRRQVAESVKTFGIWWVVDGSLRAYLPGGASTVDVLSGGLSRLRQLAGNVDLGGEDCLMADGSGGIVQAGVVPEIGEAFYYVARFRPAAGFELSYGRSSLGFRRIDLNAVCP